VGNNLLASSAYFGSINPSFSMDSMTAVRAAWSSGLFSADCNCPIIFPDSAGYSGEYFFSFSMVLFLLLKKTLKSGEIHNARR
jgi:hypothetical protein